MLPAHAHTPSRTRAIPAAAPLPVATAGAKTFRHAIEIYLKDSNAYANTYFSRYFEWQGICRERWFHQCVSQDMLQSQGVFVTKRAHQEYVHETFPFQVVECRLNTFDVRQCSFYLLFQFSVGAELVSSGWQQVVFARHDKRIQRLPEAVLAKVREYELHAPVRS